VEDRVQFVLQSKHGLKHAKSSTKTDKYHFGSRWQVRPPVWNMPANYTGEPEDAANIREVGA
jgi:hypothetical protein